MPPGPVFNAVCVASALSNILSNALRIRASQLASQTASRATATPRKHKRDVSEAVPEDAIQRHVHLPGDTSKVVQIAVEDAMSSALPQTSNVVQEVENNVAQQPPPNGDHISGSVVNSESTTAEHTPVVSEPVAVIQPEHLPPILNEKDFSVDDTLQDKSLSGDESNQSAVVDAHLVDETTSEIAIENVIPTRKLRASTVPSSRIGRLFHYGGKSIISSTSLTCVLTRSTGMSSQSSSPVMMTEANIHRLVSKLLKMRGAALKLGQFMSIQDTHVLPPAVDRIFRMVQDSAHYMPDWQMEKVLSTSLGADWPSYFDSFDRIPFAAASIGQVHRAVLSASHSPTGRAEDVAVKIQFPKIVDSIESDLGYIKMLLTASSLLPKGLFLDRTIDVMKGELADECSYIREASFLRKFGSPDFLGNDPRFKVPWVWEGSTDEVLVMERVRGVNIGEITHQNATRKLSQEERNDIASSILQLCLRELFDFRLMQTDPNWTNFLWNAQTRQIELVDFGATREYTKEFMDNWLHLLQSAISEDRTSCIEWSIKLGYLTGQETDIMFDAHVASMTLLATPFRPTTTQPFAFGPGSAWADITAKTREQIPIMLNHRLTPPPRETYSLNRKLSGSFLLASRLGARFDTRTLWDTIVGKYQFST
ncbi:hypothetical protein CCMSSC00406_0003646 [Pleurotus cornucopiae]|uniref:Uncharacterized protein n=1 Tax=Pleurotus cornucopiae TaxID=5321 RepID=A0ACB7IJ06_PLECO|nr:hypothetical protein CCMSSC00406_0003646 [Pleurotus cornucopiae]